MRPSSRRTMAAASSVALLLTLAGMPARAALDAAQLEQLTGLKPAYNEKERVWKVSFPRTDVRGTVAGVPMVPELGLTTWAAFAETDRHTEVMGDVVLLEGEVNPVMSVALENGLAVTALHNHFLWDSPRVMFMHVAGRGDAEQLARAVGRVVEKVRALIRTPPAAAAIDLDAARGTLDGQEIARALGVSGVMKNGVYKVVIGRRTAVNGHEMGAEMGVNTWAAFAGSPQQAVVDGDIAMRDAEVQAVLKALRAADISVVALHSHMIGESPRLIFLHYWGNGPAAQLAAGLKTAFAQLGPD